MDRLNFIQATSDIKNAVLLDLKNYYEQEVSLHRRSINVRISKIAEKGISEFQKKFDENFPKEICVQEGIPESLYALERDSGRSYFHSDKRTEILKSFFE